MSSNKPIMKTHIYLIVLFTSFSMAFSSDFFSSDVDDAIIHPINGFRNPVLNLSSKLVNYSQIMEPTALAYVVYQGVKHKDT